MDQGWPMLMDARQQLHFRGSSRSGPGRRAAVGPMAPAGGADAGQAE